MGRKIVVENTTALDRYINRIFSLVMLIGPIAGLSGGIVYPVRKVFGYADNASIPALIIYELFCIMFITSGIYFSKTGYDENGIVHPKMLRAGKIYVLLLAFIQWFFVLYLDISADVWGVAPFFIMCTCFFFDYIVVLIGSAEIVIPVVCCMILKGEHLQPGFIDHMSYLFVSVIAIYLLTYCGGKFLVEELEKNANYDTLTRLLNRRTLDRTLSKAYKDAQASGHDFSIVMTDIDNFKKVNDNYGHDFGDVVLRNVANTISCGVKKNDLVFRFGGEEILIVLFTEKESAINAAERIRKDICADEIKDNDKSVLVSVTMGVSSYENGKSVKSMLEEADANLYKGKNSGKNKVVA